MTKGPWPLWPELVGRWMWVGSWQQIWTKLQVSHGRGEEQIWKLSILSWKLTWHWTIPMFNGKWEYLDSFMVDFPASHSLVSVVFFPVSEKFRSWKSSLITIGSVVEVSRFQKRLPSGTSPQGIPETTKNPWVSHGFTGAKIITHISMELWATTLDPPCSTKIGIQLAEWKSDRAPKK